jgi:hypothetical protein
VPTSTKLGEMAPHRYMSQLEIYEHDDVLAFLNKYRANAKLSALGYDAVAVQSKYCGATVAQLRRST